MPSYYEFFAGGGMARAGLGKDWRCLFANDIDAAKAACYGANWGEAGLAVKCVGDLSPAEIPGRADLAWASFPCQDLSLAGGCAGLRGERSGTFWLFWRLMEKLAGEGRAPELIVLENVCGALTSHDGADFAAICGALADCGYRFGALAIDAVHFLPQSRPRLFVIAVRVGLEAARPLESLVEKFGDRSEEAERGGGRLWRSAALLAAHAKLPKRLQEAWIWWRLPIPPPRTASLEGILEADPEGVAWNTPEQTRRLQSMMSPLHRRKVESAARAQRRVAGAVYRRTRRDKKGRPLQRAGVRFDGVAGCLRTPAGGSSRQTILIVEGESVRSRLLSPREAARLMGLPESYRLPENYNQAYHLAGDGVAVPVVRFLAAHLLEPLLAASGRNKDAA